MIYLDKYLKDSDDNVISSRIGHNTNSENKYVQYF